MKSYIISIAAASVISAITSMIAPEKWSKYVGIVTGLVITLCIGRPILEIMKAEVFEGIKFEHSSVGSYSHEEYRKEVISELQDRIAADVKSRLKEEFNKECDVEVTLRLNARNEITGIEDFVISGESIDSAAVGRLREVYGVKYVKKNTGKSE